MNNRFGSAIVLAGGLALLASCGSSGGGGGSSSGGTPGFYITIHSMSFGPAELAAPPGATVTVVNQDGIQHSVTSEAVAGDFTPGAVGGVQFDTGPFTGTRTFTIPANAADGTVIPYYCTVHKSMMATPNGSLKVDSTAQPGPAPGSSSGGGGY
jgi:plastocyanin